MHVYRAVLPLFCSYVTGFGISDGPGYNKRFLSEELFQGRTSYKTIYMHVVHLTNRNGYNQSGSPSYGIIFVREGVVDCYLRNIFDHNVF